MAAKRETALASLLERPSKPVETIDNADEAGVAAFGYIRSVKERAVTLELRFRTGDIMAFPYSWLGPTQFNPSSGILLRFTGDSVYLVKISGSHLDAFMNEQQVNLTDRGLFRHRVTYVRELDQDEIRRLPRGEPTIDRIEVREFDTSEEARAWMRKYAPEFLGDA